MAEKLSIVVHDLSIKVGDQRTNRRMTGTSCKSVCSDGSPDYHRCSIPASPTSGDSPDRTRCLRRTLDEETEGYSPKKQSSVSTSFRKVALDMLLLLGKWILWLIGAMLLLFIILAIMVLLEEPLKTFGAFIKFACAGGEVYHEPGVVGFVG